MVQISNQNHPGRRDLLVACWNHIPEFFGMLPPKAQWEIHRFYAPSKALNDDEVLNHIKQYLAVEPSLAQRVGKHYKLIFTTFKFYADQVGNTDWEEIRRRVQADYVKDNADWSEVLRPAKKHVALMPIVNPEIDTAKLARTFLALADRVRESTDPKMDKAA